MTGELHFKVAADLIRIRHHNMTTRSEEAADQIEDRIIEAVRDLRIGAGKSRGDGKGWRVVTRDGNILFYVDRGGVPVVFAVYHQRENWDALVDDRMAEIQETMGSPG
jgi:plasmid stabilization system protein ParE